MAERQNWPLVNAILEYRLAETARDLTTTQEGREQLAKSPAAMQMLLEMARAQVGGYSTVEQVWGYMGTEAPEMAAT